MPTASAPDRLIVALSQLHATGQDEPTKALVGSVAGVLHTSSTMRNACANLKKNGITDCSNPKTLKLTQKGHDKARALAGAVQLPTSGTDFHARNKTMLQKMKGSGNKATEIYVSFGESCERIQTKNIHLTLSHILAGTSTKWSVAH